MGRKEPARAMTIHRGRGDGGRTPRDRRGPPQEGMPEMVLTAAQTILCLLVVLVVFTTQFVSPALFARMGTYFQAVMGQEPEPAVEVGLLDQPITWEAFLEYWERSAAQVAWADEAPASAPAAQAPERAVAVQPTPGASRYPHRLGEHPPLPGLDCCRDSSAPTPWNPALLREEGGREYRLQGAGGENPWVPPNLYLGPVAFSAQGIYPAYGKLTSPFGMRVHPITGKDDFHTGIDIAGQRGDSIYAVLPGVVEEVGESPVYGNFLKLRHSAGLVTVYCHCDRVLAPQGARLRQGERIAEMGSTGISTGNHLHFEVRVDGNYIDPMRMFAS